MKSVLVVGSGASAVHFALSALERGWLVTMVDVGHQRPSPVQPEETFVGLKERLDDPVAYFLGDAFEGVVYPGGKEEYYGFPPSKQYVFATVDGLRYRNTGFSPLWSFGQGGLGEAWTGGAYPFNDAELVDFPFSYEDIAPYYSLVAARIGITGEHDDLTRFMPLHDHVLEPLTLDEHGARLVDSYTRRRAYLNGKLSCYLGRARTAVLSRSHGGRQPCAYLGRCLWGCPIDALYTPSVTLRECQRHPNFKYVTERYVTHLRFDTGGRVKSVVARSTRSSKVEEFPVERIVLAAGTLSSSRIVLDSVYRDAGQVLELRGLMDNRQILMPFINLGMIGRPFNPSTYQYHQLAIGLEEAAPKDYVHALITTLKTALIHPIVQTVPFDLRTSLSVFRNLHAALGLVNINFPDTRRPENLLSLDVARGGDETSLVIRYTPPREERERIARAERRIKRALFALGCVAPPGMTHMRPMGASVHYAGALPMSKVPAPLTTSPVCQSHDFPNLFIVDGTTFPFLPAKNLTLTLMANAARVAAQAF